MYGDTVHRNNGRHLHRGIHGDEEMCKLYDQVISYAHPLYKPLLKDPVGKAFLNLFVAELTQVRQRKSNSEQAMLFPAVILRKDSTVTKSKDIKRRIQRRLDKWSEVFIADLVLDTVSTVQRSRGSRLAAEDYDHVAR